jgi:hypothetical protein
MNPTLKKIAICYVGLIIILIPLMKLGLPLLGILKVLLAIPPLVFGVLVILAALRES